MRRCWWRSRSLARCPVSLECLRQRTSQGRVPKTPLGKTHHRAGGPHSVDPMLHRSYTTELPTALRPALSVRGIGEGCHKGSTTPQRRLDRCSGTVAPALTGADGGAGEPGVVVGRAGRRWVGTVCLLAGRLHVRPGRNELPRRSGWATGRWPARPGGRSDDSFIDEFDR